MPLTEWYQLTGAGMTIDVLAMVGAEVRFSRRYDIVVTYSNRMRLEEGKLVCAANTNFRTISGNEIVMERGDKCLDTRKNHVPVFI